MNIGLPLLFYLTSFLCRSRRAKQEIFLCSKKIRSRRSGWEGCYERFWIGNKLQLPCCLTTVSYGNQTFCFYTAVLFTSLLSDTRFRFVNSDMMWTHHLRNVTFCARLQVSSNNAENIQLLAVGASRVRLLILKPKLQQVFTKARHLISSLASWMQSDLNTLLHIVV